MDFATKKSKFLFKGGFINLNGYSCIIATYNKQ